MYFNYDLLAPNLPNVIYNGGHINIEIARGAGGTLAAASVLQADASQFGNDESIEYQWAMKTHRHSEVYMKLISAIDPKKIKLTQFDEIIYRSFKRYFKDINVEVLIENEIKSEEAKARWRPFCEQFKGKVEDYNFGTLLRINVNEDYSEENSMLVTRIQFFAIELARNKRGLNKFHLKKDEVTAAKNDLPNNNNDDTCEEINKKLDSENISTDNVER